MNTLIASPGSLPGDDFRGAELRRGGRPDTPFNGTVQVTPSHGGLGHAAGRRWKNPARVHREVAHL